MKSLRKYITSFRVIIYYFISNTINSLLKQFDHYPIDFLVISISNYVWKIPWHFIT